MRAIFSRTACEPTISTRGQKNLATGRRSQADDIQHLHGYPALGQQVGEWIDRSRFVPRYNVAPRSHAPVLRRREAAASEGADKLVLHTMKWGLVPHWSKSESKTLNTINARSESLVEGGGMWGSIKGRKRCVVPAQGCVRYTLSARAHSIQTLRSISYYEWQKKGAERVPHFTRHKTGKLMLLAGLYDTAAVEGRCPSAALR